MYFNKNKILAVVKFNKGEAFVLKNSPKLKYEKKGDIILGSDGCFLQCYYYDKPYANWKAFAGRKFDIKLKNGEVEHCHGQWWDGVTQGHYDLIKDDIVPVTAAAKDDLRNCYVYYGYSAMKKQIEKMRSKYTGKIYEYYEYEKNLESRN